MDNELGSVGTNSRAESDCPSLVETLCRDSCHNCRNLSVGTLRNTLIICWGHVTAAITVKSHSQGDLKA